MAEHIVQFLGDAQPLLTGLPALLLVAYALLFGMHAGDLGDPLSPVPDALADRARHDDPGGNQDGGRQRRR